MDVDAVLAGLFELIAPHLTEKQRRLLAGAGARALGRGGGARMARISGLSCPTVSAGCGSWTSGPTLAVACAVGVVGPSGGPRPIRACWRRWTSWSTPTPRGDPDSPLRWTCKPTRQLAEALTAQGHPVSDDTAGRLLKQQGYTLQRTHKTLEGAQHPDRDAQSRYVNEQARSHLADGQPVVSVDTRKGAGW